MAYAIPIVTSFGSSANTLTGLSANVAATTAITAFLYSFLHNLYPAFYLVFAFIVHILFINSLRIEITLGMPLIHFHVDQL